METAHVEANFSGEGIPGNDNGAPQTAGAPADPTDWKAEAQFWQLKYFEQLVHSTQVISALSRPMIGQLQQLQQAAMLAAKLAGTR